MVQFLGNSPCQGFSQDRILLTSPCIPGEDGLTLDVTGTQLVEKDIENLARGEVKSVKWYTVLAGMGPSYREAVIPVVGVWEDVVVGERG